MALRGVSELAAAAQGKRDLVQVRVAVLLVLLARQLVQDVLRDLGGRAGGGGQRGGASAFDMHSTCIWVQQKIRAQCVARSYDLLVVWFEAIRHVVCLGVRGPRTADASSRLSSASVMSIFSAVRALWSFAQRRVLCC